MKSNLSSLRIVLIVLGWGLLLPTPGHAQLPETPGVPVKIQGSANGISNTLPPFPGEGADLFVSGSGFLAIDPVNGGGTSINLFALWNFPSSGWYSTEPETVQLEPGKIYSIFAGGLKNSWTRLAITPPSGYQVEIDGSVRPYLAKTGTSHVYSVRIVPPMDNYAGRAGAASSIAGDRLYWQVALGSLKSGGSARSLAIIDAGTASSWASLFTPAGLQYQEPSAEISVHRVSNAIRQIIANEAAVDVFTLSSTSYELRFYNPSQVIGSSGERTFSGSPFVTYKVEQGSTATTLKITSVTRDPVNSTIIRTAVTSLERTGTWPNFAWTVQDWRTDGQTALSEEVRQPLGGNTTQARSETVTVRVPGGATATQATRNYALKPWGEVLASETLGTTDAITTSYDYYTDSGHAGSYGSVKSVVVSGGGWEAFEYYDAAPGSSQMGTLKRRFRPYQNSPATVGTDPNQAGEITYFEYSADAFGKLTLPSRIRTTINPGSGPVDVADATIAYTVTTFSQISFTEIVTASRSDTTGLGGNLLSTTKYFRENTSDQFFRERIHSVQGPDGVKQSFAYQRGSWDGATFTKSGNNGLNSAPASRIAVITGTSATGTAYTVHDGYDIDDLFLVDGKSTMEVTIRDSRALVVRSESHAWKNGVWNRVAFANYTYDAAGLLTARSASNGATYSASYSGEQKTSETDESGIVVNYAYDVAGRAFTVSKVSGPSTTLTYNAVHRSLSETFSAAGTGETIQTSRSYDTAGRLTAETPAGLGTTGYSYNPSARQRTVTLPGDNATRTETYFADGRPEKVEGSGVVPEYYSYGLESDGRQSVQVNAGASGSPRWQKSWADRLGRPVRSERPGFSVTAQANFVEENAYDATTGRLTRTGRTGSAPTRYEYDALGAVIRSGLDIGDNGLVLASTDRIADSDQVFENFESAWWVRSETKTYPYANGNAVTTSVTRKRLTGYTGTLLDETRVTDAEGNTTVRTVDVNPGSKTITVTTIRPGLAANQVETIVNGLPTSAITHDGLTVSTEYDALSRTWKSFDPRNKPTTTTYKYGTAFVETVRDAANNQATHFYDTRGRRIQSQDATGKNTRFGYNQRGQLTQQWGDGTYPVSHGYDLTYGDGTSLSTYRSAPAGDSASWPAVGTADTTVFTTDAASGLLHKKTDATGKFVEHTYNVRGQSAQRFWARISGSARVTATYGYDGSTGELTAIGYSDTTPAVSYSYTRLGQIASATDGTTGQRNFNYDTANNRPWRLDNVAFPAFYGSRTYTALYENSGMVGRDRGFQIGSGVGSASDLEQAYAYTSGGRFDTFATKRANNTVSRTFRYGYLASTGLVSSISIDGAHPFTVNRGYHADLDLLTSIDTKWSTASRTRYDYTHNALYQRDSARQSGDVFGDYGEPTFNRYSYNARGELTGAPAYMGSNVADLSRTLPGRQHAFDYDSIGNRKSTNRTGNAALKESYFGNDTGTQEGANALNQYKRRENDSIAVQGTVDAAGTTVAVAGSAAAAGRQGRYWAAEAVVSNGSGPWQGSLLAYAAKIAGGSGGADLIRTEIRTAIVAQALQAFAYDDDGNLSTDGLWDYQWDAENRLIRMATTTVAASFGITNRVLEFRYDYRGRRVQKRVLDGGTFAEISSRRYLYNGWDLVAEFEAPGGSSLGSLVRSYTWGLDLTGSLTASGGVGALLQIHDYAAGKTLLPTYDGNGNIASLLDAVSGSLEAAYEYDPSGQLLRAEGAYAKTNPFRFSTKFQDEETGLIYYGLRYYSPTMGRFVCRDPIEESGGLNLYAFCTNNGVNRFDFLGFWACGWSSLGTGDGSWVTSMTRYGEGYVAFLGGDSDFGRDAEREYDQRVRQAQQNLRLISDARSLDNAAANGQPLDPKVLAAVEAALMSADVYNKPGSPTTGLVPYLQRVPDSVTAVLGIDPAFLSNSDSGFHAGVYFNQRTNDYVIAYRGTEPGALADWRANAAQAAGLFSAQYDQAVNLAKIADTVLDAQFMNNLMFTGHSLGGGLASVAAIRTNNPAITFNAAGLSRGTINRYGLDMSTAPGLITAYYIGGDILSTLQDILPFVPSAAGTRVPLETDQLRAPVGVGKHSLSNFVRFTGGGSEGGPVP